jgi:cell division protein FtsI/penicillin-binding protein 2
LYNQRPPGLEVRLSLDLDLQRRIDPLMEGHQGAMVLLNALSGEILAMSSQPYFDPNQIDALWLEWIQDESAPLLNRAALGQYPPGTALGPFLLAYRQSRGMLPLPPTTLTHPYQDETWNCTVEPPPPLGWGTIVSSGCPGGLISLAEGLSGSELADLYRLLGFDQEPQIRLPVAIPEPITPFPETDLAAIGQADTLVSPLQMALAAAALSSNGERPSPQLATSVNTPLLGWVVLPGGTPTFMFPPAAIAETTNLLAIADSPFWQVLASGFTPDGPITWYISGTRASAWQGTPLTLVLVLEEDNPSLAQTIGEQILRSTIQP